MKKKSILAILLAASMILTTLSACSSEPADTGADDTGAQTDTGGDEVGGSDEPFNLTGGLPILNEGAEMPEISILFREFAGTETHIADSVQVARYLEETGLYFDWELAPSEGYNEKLTVRIATNDLPDMVWTPLSDDQVLQAMGQDVFLPTNDLIEQYVPNLVSIFDDFPEFKSIATAPDGNMYGFPYIVQMDGLILSPGPIMINQVWLDELGLDMPTTVEEYVSTLEAFEEAGDLNGNGVDDEFAYAGSFAEAGAFGSNKTFNQFTAAFGQANSAFGTLYDNLGVVDGKVMYTAMDEAYKETAKMFHQMNLDGLIDPDSFSNEIKTVEDKLKTDIAVLGSFGVWSPETTIVDPAIRAEYSVVPRLEGAEGMTGFALNASEVQSKSHLNITTSSEYPELLAAFVNYLYIPEISVTSVWGAEGEGWMYHKDENGMLVFNVDEDNNLILAEGMESFWTVRTNSGPVEGGAVLDEYYGTVCEYAWDAVTLHDGQIASGSREILEEYDVILPAYLEPEINSRASQIQTQLKAIVDRYTMSWVLDGGVDDTWDAYIAEMEAAGVAEFVEIIQTSYDTVA